MSHHILTLYLRLTINPHFLSLLLFKIWRGVLVRLFCCKHCYVNLLHGWPYAVSRWRDYCWLFGCITHFIITYNLHVLCILATIKLFLGRLFSSILFVSFVLFFVDPDEIPPWTDTFLDRRAAFYYSWATEFEIFSLHFVSWVRLLH